MIKTFINCTEISKSSSSSQAFPYDCGVLFGAIILIDFNNDVRRLIARGRRKSVAREMEPLWL